MRALALIICIACALAFMLAALLAFIGAGNGRPWPESFAIGLCFACIPAFDLLWEDSL